MLSTILIIIAIIFLILSINFHKDKEELEFKNRPIVITNPAQDLFTNQKYAIVKLLAYIQGANSQTAYSEEANRIAQSTIFSLGLNQKEIVKVLQMSMNREPISEMNRIVDSLHEIRDKNYLTNLYNKCMEIAIISGDNEMISMTKEIFKELNII